MIEDDDQIADFVVQGLREAGYAVDRACEGSEGLVMAKGGPYDAMIVDLMLPRVDGLSLIEDLRRHGNTTPVIILSARRSVDDRIKGLRAGGDDYLTKPFSFAELLARIQALIRRSAGGTEPTALTAGPVRIDLLTRQVLRSGKTVELQPREYSLLEYLIRNSDRVVTKTMILEHVWDYDFEPQTNVVDVLVHRLRKKIDHGFDPPLIHTLRGVGYVLRTP